MTATPVFPPSAKMTSYARAAFMMSQFQTASFDLILRQSRCVFCFLNFRRIISLDMGPPGPKSVVVKPKEREGKTMGPSSSAKRQKNWTTKRVDLKVDLQTKETP